MNTWYNCFGQVPWAEQNEQSDSVASNMTQNSTTKHSNQALTIKRRTLNPSWPPRSMTTRSMTTRSRAHWSWKCSWRRMIVHSGRILSAWAHILWLPIVSAIVWSSTMLELTTPTMHHVLDASVLRHLRMLWLRITYKVGTLY